MFFIKLNTLETVNEFCKISEKFRDEIDIDVNYGRQTVDACSILGVTSLIGNIVKVVPICNDKNILDEYFEKIKKIGAYEV